MILIEYVGGKFDGRELSWSHTEDAPETILMPDYLPPNFFEEDAIPYSADSNPHIYTLRYRRTNKMHGEAILYVLEA